MLAFRDVIGQHAGLLGRPPRPLTITSSPSNRPRLVPDDPFSRGHGRRLLRAESGGQHHATVIRNPESPGGIRASQPESHQGVEGREVKSEEGKRVSVDTSRASGATRASAAEDLDPGRERRPLESYFQEIGGTRTLRREEEVILAKELESATQELRDCLYAVPALRAPRRAPLGRAARAVAHRRQALRVGRRRGDRRDRRARRARGQAPARRCWCSATRRSTTARRRSCASSRRASRRRCRPRSSRWWCSPRCARWCASSPTTCAARAAARSAIASSRRARRCRARRCSTGRTASRTRTSA